MYKRTDGRYRERITLPDGKVKEFNGRTQKEVIRKIAAWTEEQQHGRLFKDVAADWWEQTIDTLAYNTRKPYQPAIRRACEELGGRQVKDIKPPEIASHIERMSLTYSDKAVRTQLQIYGQIFKWAVAHGDADVNPCRDLTVPKGLPKGKRTMPSSEDIQRIKDGVTAPFGLFAYMALYTGLRRGELLALTYQDIDRKRRAIRVNKSLYHEGNQPKIKAPKTEASAAEVPILDALMKVLPKQHIGVVFADSNGEYLSDTEFRIRWRAYVKATGVTCTPHQLRHAYTVMLYEAGLPPDQMQALLRHAQLGTTMDIYNELRENQRQKIFERVFGIDIH